MFCKGDLCLSLLRVFISFESTAHCLLLKKAEEAKPELQKINTQCVELEKKENELKEKEVDVRHNLQQCDNVYKENSAKLKFHKDKVYVCYYYTITR